MAQEAGAIQQIRQDEQKVLGLIVSEAIQAEGDFLGMYDAVMQNMQREEYKNTIGQFRRDHERHVTQMKEAAQELDIDVPMNEPKPSPMGETIAMKLRNMNNEKELLKEFMIGEDFSRKFYHMMQSIEVPDKLAQVMRQAMEDEEKHHRWATEQVQSGQG